MFESKKNERTGALKKVKGFAKSLVLLLEYPRLC